MVVGSTLSLRAWKENWSQHHWANTCRVRKVFLRPAQSKSTYTPKRNTKKVKSGCQLFTAPSTFKRGQFEKNIQRGSNQTKHLLCRAGKVEKRSYLEVRGRHCQILCPVVPKERVAVGHNGWNPWVNLVDLCSVQIIDVAQRPDCLLTLGRSILASRRNKNYIQT